MSDAQKSPVSRRALVAGAGVAGVAAATTTLLPGTQAAAPQASSAAATGTDPGPQGYRLTAHIQRYYQTAKV